MFADNEYGRQFRSMFRDNRGTSELGMLGAPTADELEQIKKAVAIMTAKEKDRPEDLSDEQIKRIADDAGVDGAIVAIFINGFVLERKAG